MMYFERERDKQNPPYSGGISSSDTFSCSEREKSQSDKESDTRLHSFIIQERTGKKPMTTVTSAAIRTTKVLKEVNALRDVITIRRRRPEVHDNTLTVELAIARIAEPCKWNIQSFCFFDTISGYGIYHLEKFISSWVIFTSMFDFFFRSFVVIEPKSFSIDFF